jgi:hypothetical protein
MNKFRQLGIDTCKHWREISLIYFVQLIIGLLVSVTFYSEFSHHIDKSMILDQLAKGFDRTVFMDLINSNDQILGKTKITALCLLGIYLFIGVFLQGGWLTNIRKKSYSVQTLLSSGLKLFGPFIGIAAISILLVAIFGGLLGFFFIKIVGDPLVTFSSEKPYVIWIVLLIGMFILWSISIWAWSVISRCHYIDGNSFFTSLRLGFQTLRKKWLKFQTIGMLIVGIHVLFMFLYYWILGDKGAPSWGVVLVGIFVQQVFNYLRVLLRGFGYSLVEDLV